MGGDAERGGEAGGADAANGEPPPVRLRRDAVVLFLGRGTDAGIDGGHGHAVQSR